MEQQSSQTLPSSMRYGKAKLTSVPASTTLRLFTASNGNSFNQNTNEIRIPVSTYDGFLDTSKCYIQLTITNDDADNTHTVTLTSDIACVIDQLRIESNGVILENIDKYNLYHNHKSLWSVDEKDKVLRSLKAGGPAGDTNSGDTVAGTASKTFIFQPKSAFLASHHKKAIPMGCSFDIVLRLARAQECLRNSANANSEYTISNPRFYAPMYKIDDPSVMSDYMSVINSSPLSWTGDTAKTYTSPVPAATTGIFTAQLNDRSLSLKGVVSILRANTVVVDPDGTSLEGRNHNISSYVYKFDGQNFPSDQVMLSDTEIGRAVEELSKVYQDDGYKGIVPRANFLDGADAGERMGSIAIDLKKFDDDQLKMVGMNTARNNTPSTVEITFRADPGASELTSYALCEATFTRLPNGAIQVAV